MGFVQFLINKLAGYDINFRQMELDQTISSLKNEKNRLHNSVNQLQERLSTAEIEKTNSNTLVDELKANNKVLQREKTSISNQLSQVQGELEESKKKTTHISNQLNAYKTNFTKVKKAKDEIQAKYTEETESLQKIIKNKEDELLSLENQLKGIQLEKEELRATLVSKEEEVAKQNETIIALTQDKSKYGEIIAKNEQALQSIKDAKESIIKELDEKQQQLAQKEVEIKQINASLSQLQEESHKSQSNADEIRELEKQIQDLQEQLSDTRREIEIQNSQLEQKEKEIREIGNSLTKANESIKDLQDKVDAANNEIHNKENEILRLKEIINKQEALEIKTQESSTEVSITPKQERSEVDSPIEPSSQTSTDDALEKKAEPIEQFSSVSSEPDEKVPVKNDETNEIKNTYRIGARKKTKEEEAIEMSGNSMMDFPPIINDSNKNAQRSIEYVYDKEGHKIYANDFFGGSAEEIARKSRQLEEAGMMGKSDFVCGMCHRPVKIAHRTINGRESLFFAHATRNEYCAWIPYSTSSKDDDILVDELDIDSSLQEVSTKPHSRVLKEMIFSLLCTPESEELGISDVKCDAIIRSSVPYMKWRRPDISFKFQDRDVVIVLQRKKHDLHMLVDRDVFFRLNNYHVIWVFGADNDVSYDYMRMSNYKNTLYDCHRNVFVFDKEAQQKSEEKNTLCLKYNWLDENDNWAVKHSTLGSNGLIADISDFIFDDEYCKPYIREANEPYFRLHPDAREQYLETRKSREQLLKEFEEKWKGEPSYEEALRVMKQREEKATPFQYMGLWGFRFNTTTLIQPVFTEQPVDLRNGFFMVKQGETAGIVTYYGEVIMDWTTLECDSITVDVANNRVMFLSNGSWGIADFMGNILIDPQFAAISPWSDTIYRVRLYNLWGLHSIEDTTVAQCVYDSIGELTSGQAEAVLRDKEKSWVTYKGLLDSNGHVIDTNTSVINDYYTAFERFAKWGIRSINGLDVIEPTYEEIKPWSDEAVRVKNNSKWGVISLPNGDYILSVKYDSIGALTDGKAHITYVGVTNIVDANGNIMSEESIQLQNGFVKSKIGGKWGIEKDGKVIVQHKYDEIGSFRQRLIGVINSSIVKLNAYYDYPIHISGKCCGLRTGGAKVDISGVICSLPNAFIKNAGLEGKIFNGYIFNDIAFGNLIFSQERYLLRFVSEAQMQKKTSHGDKETDYSMNEIVSGTITEIMRYKTQGGKLKTTKVKLKITDGRETMIPRRFFIAAGLNISDFSKGDAIQIQKIGFDDELDQTTWKITDTNIINP